MQLADDTLSADDAYRLACSVGHGGCSGAVIFRTRASLLQAMARRCDRPVRRPAKAAAVANLPAEAFHRQRMAQAQRARTLGMLLLPVDAGHRIPLRRAPDVEAACCEAYGAGAEPYVVALRELLGLIGAHQWRQKGVDIAALGAPIHPHYGVFFAGARVRQCSSRSSAAIPVPAKIRLRLPLLSH